jgi:hypothetical protein
MHARGSSTTFTALGRPGSVGGGGGGGNGGGASGGPLTKTTPVAAARCILPRRRRAVVVAAAARSSRRRQRGAHEDDAPATLLPSGPQRRRAPRVATAAAAPDSSSSSSSAAPADQTSDDGDGDLSGAYSADMQAKMGTSLVYRHELGTNWDRITPDLIVGSCPQTPADVDRLAEEGGVTTIFCLQEDCDLDYFGIDVASIAARCAERGDVRHVRFPIRDFDPFELRRLLPRAVARLALAHRPRPAPRGPRGPRSADSPHPATLPAEGTGSVYIHCTAGMGRAPATALAYMAWLRGWDVDDAYAHLRARRACSPKVEAVRSATADLLLGCDPIDVTVSLPRRGTVSDARVAGLDVGWGEQLPMAFNPKTGRLEVTRRLMPGRYPFKFVLDGQWAASLDYPTVLDGDNVNNVLEVLPRDEAEGGALTPEEAARRAAQRDRLTGPGGRLTDEERMELAAMLCPWATHRKTDHLTPVDG